MHILSLNPYHGGSHAATATGYQAHSSHQVTLLTLPIAGGWRWRMRGAAVTFARLVREQGIQPDAIFTTDMLDLATFRALTQDIYVPHLPAAVYFFENQLTYPLPRGRTRDLSFAWTNYTTALTAQRVLFNSTFHRAWFLDALPAFLGRYHDYNELHTIDAIADKSYVLPTGIDLQRLACHAPLRRDDGPPIIIWASRWDYDKQPHVFFDALEALQQLGGDFRLIVAGEAVDPHDPVFVAARERWQSHIIHWGYPHDMQQYSTLLHQADIFVSTAIQETLGIGLIEALYCGCIPILPHRLVYPEVLPSQYHAECLYDGDSLDDLVALLLRTLQRCTELRRYDWQAIAAGYDWAYMAPRYDACLSDMRG